MNPKIFAKTAGVIEGVVFAFVAVVIFFEIFASAKKLLPTVLPVLILLSALVGWQSFRMIEALFRPERSFMRIAVMGVVSGAVIGSLGITYLLLIDSKAGSQPLSSFPINGLIFWLVAGGVSGLVYAIFAWLLNAAIVATSMRFLGVRRFQNGDMASRPFHKHLLVSTLLMAVGLFVFGFVRHGWHSIDEVKHQKSGPTISRNANGLYGATSSNGRVVIPYRFAYAAPLKNRFVLVREDIVASGVLSTQYGVLSIDGRVVLPTQFTGIEYDEKRRRFKVSQGDGELRFGILDESGRTVVPVLYERMDRISNLGSEPTQLIVLDGKHGYLNHESGQMLIKPIYDELHVFSELADANGEGVALAKVQGQWAVLSTDGKALTAFEYDDIQVEDYRTLVATKSGKQLRWVVDGKRLIDESQADPLN